MTNINDIAKSIMEDKRSNKELYDSILDRIRQMYNNKLPEQEVHEAARRLIEFMQIVMKVNIRKQEEKNNKT